MSSFTKAQTQINQIEIELSNVVTSVMPLLENSVTSELLKANIDYQTLQSKSSEYSNYLSRLKVIESNLSNLNQMLTSNYVNKLNHVDPITSTPRFGFNMKSKIENLHSKLITLSDQVTGILLILEDVVSKLNDRLQEIKSECPDIDKLIEDNNLSNVMPTSHNDDDSLIDLQIHNEDLMRLHAEAENARSRKRKRNDFRNIVISKFQEKLNDINSKRWDINEALGLILIPSNDRVKIITAISTISDLLNRISLKTDDVKLRKLKLSNPVFYEKVLKIEDSYKILLAIGFYFKLEPTEEGRLVEEGNREKVIPELESLIDTLVHQSNSSVSANVDSFVKDSIKSFVSEIFQYNVSATSTDYKALNVIDKLIALSETLSMTLVMQMNEPTVDSNNSNSDSSFADWIKWFDSLTIHKDILMSFVVKTFKE